MEQIHAFFSSVGVLSFSLVSVSESVINSSDELDDAPKKILYKTNMRTTTKMRHNHLFCLQNEGRVGILGILGSLGIFIETIYDRMTYVLQVILWGEGGKYQEYCVLYHHQIPRNNHLEVHSYRGH
jgi:hypothetical protein